MKYGMISTGSKEASQTALEILKLGGNAFDASIAAVMTSMTSEVNLTSMAGGGALLAYINGQEPILYDFFVDAPCIDKNKNFEFYNTAIDFGETEQVFHIGKGSIAIPGNIKGLLYTHAKLGRLPLKIITEPAKEIAKNGVKLSPSQAYITSLLSSIIDKSKDSIKLFFKKDKIISEGDMFLNPDFSDFIEWITEEGDRPFYEGEIGRKMVDYLGEDGLISMEGLKSYQVYEREPLKHEILNRMFFTNPAPSVGGTLIIFLLSILQKINSNYKFDNLLLVKIMAATARARYDYFKNPNDEYQLNLILDNAIIDEYVNLTNNNILDQAMDFTDNGFGSTTHVSVVDKDGNASSITTTNGESCGHVLPGTGVILNNMLGEQDLNPLGFHNWDRQKRMPTLISPSLLLNKNGKVDLVIGSAGSNRIRSAIIQVIGNYLIKGMTLKESIYASRLHLEDNQIYLEPKIEIDNNLLSNKNIRVNEFHDINLFFGGVNAVTLDEAVSDPRRGGCALEC